MPNILFIYCRTTENGEIKQICYGDHVRSTKIKVPEAKLSSFYDALIQFLEYAYSPANMIQYKMKSGTMTSIDNYRVFHGRTAFQPNPNSFRYVEGGYIDWDEAASRMRTLEDQLKIDYSTPII